jgi:translocation and assembly module TamA
VVLAAALTLAWPVGALDGVRFRVAQSDPGVEAALRAASLVLEAEREGRVSAQDIFAAAQADYQRLLAALYASGRYGGAISIRIDGAEAADLAPLDAPRRIGTVEVGVDPGPLFTFGAAQIEPLAPGTELPEAFAPGLPARSPVVSDAARAAIEGWRAAGHPKAAIVDQGLLARHGARELDVRAGIDPGPRAVLGHLRIVGETQVRPERLAAIAGFEAGAAFSPEALERVVERLRRTGTFRAVSIAEAPTINTDGSLDAEVTVLDNAPRRIGFGAETSSSEGVGVSAYWLHRNLAGGAERLRLDGAISQIGAKLPGIDYRLSALFERPATLSPDTSLGLGLTLAQTEDGPVLTKSAEIAVRFTHLLSPDLTLRGGVEIDIEESTDSDPAPGTRSTFRSVALPLGAIRDRRDNVLDPSEGYLIDAAVMPFRGVGATDDGVRLTLDARGYRRIGERVTFAARLQAGAVEGAEIARTPREYLFRSGGAGTVRGQPYRSLDLSVCRGPLPVASSGCSVGGRYFVATAFELRARLQGKLGAVVYADYGRIGTTSFTFPEGLWHAGAGIGLRYETGIGPIRFDVGIPTGGATGNGSQFYVGIGQAF